MARMFRKPHHESHLIHHTGWLRAAVLGANDGLLSTASLVSGMAAGGAPNKTILLAGLAGLVAGATAMATGEYVSVSSQTDIETADIEREKKELAEDPGGELEELTQLYVARGLELPLARTVATQLMAKNALGAHVRDELGISDTTVARPLQAALASAASFTAGAIIPLVVTAASPPQFIVHMVIGTTLLALTALGMLGALTSGSPILKPTLRVFFWGSVSLSLTTLVGKIFEIQP